MKPYLKKKNPKAKGLELMQGQSPVLEQKKKKKEKCGV
jgi:hypothetical protein